MSEQLDDCHLIHLSYMADGPDDTPIATRASCKLCGQAWEFIATTDDVKEYEAERDSQAQLIARLVEALAKIAEHEFNDTSNACWSRIAIARAALAETQALTEKQANE